MRIILILALLVPLGCFGAQASILPQRTIAVSELQAKADQELTRALTAWDKN